METYFASPQRSSSDELEKQIRFATENPVMDAVLSSAGGLVAVLNQHRQIVSINDLFLEKLGIDDPKQVLGFRPGEAIVCVHSDAEEGGCGTARPCATCGAAIAIVSSMTTGEPVERKCVATVRRGDREEDLYLNVRAVLLESGYEPYVLLFLHDITTAQNHAALDRMFFHDLANILTGLVSVASLLDDGGVSMDEQLQRIIVNQVKHLDKEVEMQRLICNRGDSGFRPDISPVTVETIWDDMEMIFSNNRSAEGKRITFTVDPGLDLVKTDRYVLLRVLANMVVNAAEATELGGEVKVHFGAGDGCLEISVWNRAFIPNEVALRVFQRNFSTKGSSGRGLGTYSMKLFTEKYLRGEVAFTSSQEAGTTFVVSLPLAS